MPKTTKLQRRNRATTIGVSVGLVLGIAVVLIALWLAGVFKNESDSDPIVGSDQRWNIRMKDVQNIIVYGNSCYKACKNAYGYWIKEYGGTAFEVKAGKCKMINNGQIQEEYPIWSDDFKCSDPGACFFCDATSGSNTNCC